DHADERGLIAPLAELMPQLRRALDRCRALGVEAITKYVPRCLLGEHGPTLDNGQADVIIVESFWDHFPKFGCLYEAVGDHSEECLGLHHDYIDKFGWEKDALSPAARTRPWAPRRGHAAGRPERHPNDEPARPLGHPAWEALLAGLPPSEGRVIRVQLTR